MFIDDIWTRGGLQRPSGPQLRETDTRSEAEILEIHGMGKTSTRLEAGFLGIHGAGKASTRSEGMILGEASDPEDKYYVAGENPGIPWFGEDKH